MHRHAFRSFVNAVTYSAKNRRIGSLFVCDFGLSRFDDRLDVLSVDCTKVSRFSKLSLRRGGKVLTMVECVNFTNYTLLRQHKALHGCCSEVVGKECVRAKK